jgi:hypothetical protein
MHRDIAARDGRRNGMKEETGRGDVRAMIGKAQSYSFSETHPAKLTFS